MISSLPTIAKAAEQIRRGQLTPSELVEFCLARIDQFEDQIRAWVVVDREGARREASRQTAAIQAGEELGPLAGIPIGIKDIIDVASWPTGAGSPLRCGHVADRDATLVARLREAGAIVLGKTVTTQFACFDPPVTANPWNADRTPGGSSSGSAAAVALEMCMAAIGTQTGGSIVRPASFCGVCGLKPTFGHIPLDGVVPLSRYLDHAGPITRSVSDLVRLYAVLADEDSLRHCFVQHTIKQMVNFDAEWPDLAQPGQAFVRLVFDQAFHAGGRPAQLRQPGPAALQPAAANVLAVTRAVLDRWHDPAWAEQTWELPASSAELLPHHRRIMAVDAALVHRPLFSPHRDEFAPHIARLITEGLETAAVDYAAALLHQTRFQNELAAAFQQFGLLALPATTSTAPTRESTGNPAFNSPWSYAGVPSVTIPCGLADDGLPCGLQLIGPRHSELWLLHVAAWWEEQIDFRMRPGLLNG